METSRLKKAVSPHRISGSPDETPAAILGRDLLAINEFLRFVDVEPYLIPEKIENFKRVPFKKVKIDETIR